MNLVVFCVVACFLHVFNEIYMARTTPPMMVNTITGVGAAPEEGPNYCFCRSRAFQGAGNTVSVASERCGRAGTRDHQTSVGQINGWDVRISVPLALVLPRRSEATKTVLRAPPGALDRQKQYFEAPCGAAPASGIEFTIMGGVVLAI